jgi:hypothetical protein
VVTGRVSASSGKTTRLHTSRWMWMLERRHWEVCLSACWVGWATRRIAVQLNSVAIAMRPPSRASSVYAVIVAPNDFRAPTALLSTLTAIPSTLILIQIDFQQSSTLSTDGWKLPSPRRRRRENLKRAFANMRKSWGYQSGACSSCRSAARNG